MSQRAVVYCVEGITDKVAVNRFVDEKSAKAVVEGICDMMFSRRDKNGERLKWSWGEKLHAFVHVFHACRVMNARADSIEVLEICGCMYFGNQAWRCNRALSTRHITHLGPGRMCRRFSV